MCRRRFGIEETRLAQIRKEHLTVDAAVQVVEDVLGGMRTEGLQLTDAMERKDAREASVLAWRGEAEDLMERTLTEVRVNALGFLAELVRDHGLNLRELDQKFLSTLSGNLETPVREVQMLADNCADTER